ncbi:hypothetical protein A265_01816 (plasmid) [Zymomonas mobilis subsp. mobilis str. CP4 = NRRL B-14023]|nr:hypothetical protein ZCP4_1885 [Zymomonas mobilis subsp. mobilis str. CP4 = NRRL B-14023]AHJ71401.1 hypothetical protein A254_01816 [Zymomonas mobilis subsp. mobilis NRRL B-12526]AHJ73255.1 hypothetical protein A265_01816 [Zymomonas mobilis subsp. mobilis str. CP4 = NRRL B-14023]
MTLSDTILTDYRLFIPPVLFASLTGAAKKKFAFQ